MAKILNKLNTKIGIKYFLEVDKEEIIDLKGNFKGLLVLNRNEPPEKVGIFHTGISNSTMYFEIPRKFELKSGRKKKKIFNDISCQIVDREDHYLFVYVVDKSKKS